MNKNTQLVVIVVVGVLVITGAYYLFTMPATPAPVTAIPAATTTDVAPVVQPSTTPSAPATTNYNNPELGFSFTKPTTWTVASPGTGTVYFTDSTSKTNRVMMAVTVTPNTSNQILVELKQQAMKIKDGENVITADFHDTTFAGEPAFSYVNEEGSSQPIFVTIHGGKIYTIETGFVDSATLATFTFIN